MTLRGGMWAVVFTDLVDSTAQRARVGDAAADALRREHDAVVAAACVAHEGHVVKSTGDGSMAVFTGAADAVSAAVAIQQGIERRNRAAPERLGLRVGISLGDLGHEDGDLFGMPVNEAARLCALAETDEILLSDLVRVVAGSRVAHGLSDRGRHDLKGIPEAVQVWAAAWGPAPVTEGAPLPSLLVSSGAMAFSGRTAELAELAAEWELTKVGHRRAVLVSGEPGIGKTRLAAEVACVAHDEGALVLYGRSDDDLGISFQPFAEVLDWYYANSVDSVAGESPGELARLSWRVAEREGAPAEPQPDPEVAQYRLFDAVASWFGALTDHQPVMLVLDDLHWASMSTLLMLRHLLRAIDESPLLVIGTYRDTDLDRQRPLGAMLPDLGRLPQVKRQALAGLDEQGVEELLERVGEQPLDEDARELGRALRSETGGNAFFIGEILEHLVDTGVIIRGGGSWSRAPSLSEIGIPQGVKEVLGQRLTRLGDAVTEVLQAASVIGRDFDARLVAAASGLPDDAVVDALDRALEALLVEDIGRGSYRFSHALIRSALLDELSTARRMRLHRNIAATLEAVRTGDLMGIAFHWTEAALAGDPPRAIDAGRRAAQQALARAAFGEAVVLLERALDLALEAELDSELRAHVLLDLADARMAVGDVDDARDTYVAAVEQGGDDTGTLTRAALSFHGPPRVESIDPRHIDLLRRALEAVDPVDTPDLAARLHASMALRLEPDPHSSYVVRAEELGARSGPPETRMLLHQARFWTSLQPDGGARHEAAEMLRAALESGSISAELAALELCIITASQDGGPAAARDDTERHRRLAEESGLQNFIDFQVVLDARAYLAAGNHETAMSLAQNLVDRAPNQNNLLTWATVSAQQLWLTDRREELERTAREWLDAGLIPEATMTYAEALLARVLADLGRRVEGAGFFDRVVANGFERLSPLGTPMCPGELATLADVCSALRDVDNANELLSRLEPWRGIHLQLTLAEYCGPATLFLGRLERTAGLIDEAVASLACAVEEARDADAPLKVAEAKLELAATLAQRRNDRDAARARSLIDDVAEFAQPLGLARLSRRADELSDALDVG